MTAYPGPIYGEELSPTRARDLLKTFGGCVLASARRAFERADGLAAGDPDASIAQTAENAIRFAGLRDTLVAGHPVVADLSATLAAHPDVIPAPEEDVVARLSVLDGYARDGKVISIYGVPVPAGRRQTDYYVVLRWRPLYSPFALPHLIYGRDPADVRPTDRAALGVDEGEDAERIHLVDHDARHVTDETQASLLMFSTAIHRDNLVELQTSNPELFVALWRRDMDEAWRLGRKMRSTDLPASNPKSRIRNRLRRLLYSTALMSEWERVFEIIGALSAERGVTRDSVRAALLNCSSLTGVALVEVVPEIWTGA